MALYRMTVKGKAKIGDKQIGDQIMECVALIISVVSLIIAYLALFYSVLKQGRVEIFPYLDCLEVSNGSKHLDTQKEFAYIVPFMIKHSGA